MTDLTPDTMRDRLISHHGLDSKDATLITGPGADTMMAQAQRLVDLDHQAWLSTANVAPREGLSPSAPSASTDIEFVRDLFGDDE